MSMEITLAIDCAVSRGSVALFRDGSVVASTSGTDQSPSRAEEVLGVIQTLLSNAGTQISDVSRIIVSTGPGSYSGIRIGIATALGLKNALGVECFGASVLDALAARAEGVRGVIAAIPVGKKDVAWQAFTSEAARDAQLSNEVDFVSAIGESGSVTLVAHSELLERVGDRFASTVNVMDAGTAVAEWIGRPDFHARSLPAPIYLRNKSHGGGSRF